MKLHRALIPVATALFVLMIVTALYPPKDDFHPQNTYWNGLERAARELNAEIVRLSDAYALDPFNYTLIILGPSKPFALEDVKAVEAFLAKGGRVIVADDYGTANQLLEALSAPLRIVQGVLVDPLLNLGVPQLPLAFRGSRRVALNYAAALNISACGSCKVLAESSPFSYLDANVDGKRDDGEPEGPLPVAASLRWGAGELVVIADSSLFINSMMDREENAETLRELLGGARPAIVADMWVESALARAKNLLAVLHRLLQSPELKYSLAAALLLASFEGGRRLERRNR